VNENKTEASDLNSEAAARQCDQISQIFAIWEKMFQAFQLSTGKGFCHVF
jgi:hypothetical protein